MTNHGVVCLMGKPDRVIYDRVLEMTGSEASPEEAIAVGDSLEHDVAGANGKRGIFFVERRVAPSCAADVNIHAKELRLLHE